jgi:lauroyl/myristoyl acyltransferase
MKRPVSKIFTHPDLLFPPVMIGLGIGYWLLRGRRMRLKQRTGRTAFYNLYRMGRNLACMLGADAVLLRGDPEPLSQGGILYSFHFGAWELMPRVLGRLGYDLGIIANRYGDRQGLLGRAVDRFLRWFRTRPNVRVFHPGDGLKIARFIRKGGLFGVLVDGNTFFGKFARVQKLSRLCGAPLIPFAVYQDRGRAVLELNCDLDRLVRERPFDYLWAYRSRERS